MGRPHSRRANAAARRTDPRANAELYPVTITAHESVPTPGFRHDDWPPQNHECSSKRPDAIPPGTEAVELARGIDTRRELGRALNRPAHIAGDVGRSKGLSILRESFAIGEATEAARAYKYLPLLLYLPAGGGANLSSQ